MSILASGTRKGFFFFAPIFPQSSRFLSSSQFVCALHREGAKVYKDFETIRKKREELKRLSEKRREENEITDRLVLQVSFFLLTSPFSCNLDLDRHTRNSKRRGLSQEEGNKSEQELLARDENFIYFEIEKVSRPLVHYLQGISSAPTELKLGHARARDPFVER
jgi:hypothetical protein